MDRWQHGLRPEFSGTFPKGFKFEDLMADLIAGISGKQASMSRLESNVSMERKLQLKLRAMCKASEASLHFVVIAKSTETQQSQYLKYGMGSNCLYKQNFYFQLDKNV